MALLKTDTFHAACRIQADGLAFLLNRGFASVAPMPPNNGEYLLTLELAIATTQRLVITGLDGTAGSQIARTVNTSSTQIQVLVFDVDGTTGKDAIISVLVLRIIAGS